MQVIGNMLNTIVLHFKGVDLVEVISFFRGKSAGINVVKKRKYFFQTNKIARARRAITICIVILS